MDQCLLAAPHGFAQRATSFIASWRQGIHQMPLSASHTRPIVQTSQTRIQTSELCARRLTASAYVRTIQGPRKPKDGHISIRQPAQGNSPGPSQRIRNHSGRLHASAPNAPDRPPPAKRIRGHRTKTATLFLFTMSIIRYQEPGVRNQASGGMIPHTILAPDS
jgi:hypothetical protein